ncbi:MAG: type VI secretion system protein TssL [SAR86 cluster bacterium]|uniref:Type VI secretion system protein TssL n=1 Tax=SAR86 cluster bacterium TaxID=2030880 RepID=A0A2A5CAN3_9GAMM|nr:OmpA family protein [Gammaproteobacteria bacterium AH-315-E17]PCJ40862.1 MAG: type VI secretion system protein TssL [SAR86 cluster bacterium]
MTDFADETEESSGAPAWMATFADLMSLLMCFFVLLLSFSEMDVQKYKLVAGSMKNAFGVQTEVIATEDPLGASGAMESEFQQSSDLDDSELDRLAMMEELQALMLETAQDVENLEENMREEIANGSIEIESGFRTITIRIKEKGSFGSGSADLQTDFVPVMAKLQSVLEEVDGRISIEGHTDNIDISTARFSSNWALSSARALSVGNELLKDGVIESDRFVISGYSDTVPFADNATAEGRAINRRVEIVIRQPVSEEISLGLRDFDANDPELLNALDGVSVDQITPQ